MCICTENAYTCMHPATATNVTTLKGYREVPQVTRVGRMWHCHHTCPNISSRTGPLHSGAVDRRSPRVYGNMRRRRRNIVCVAENSKNVYPGSITSYHTRRTNNFTMCMLFVCLWLISKSRTLIYAIVPDPRNNQLYDLRVARRYTLHHNKRANRKVGRS